jgi:nucleoside-diphosphate-sugar epimerase
VEVDEIYNLACPASPVHYQFDPVQTTKTSVHGAINMLGLAKRVRATIVQASTSEVYGDPEVHPQKESYWGRVNPIGPRACYDEGKRCAETLFFDYHAQHGLGIKVARIFNTYGPRMHPNDGRVVSNFIVQALKGEPITIYGEGSQTRSFCYVDDLIDGLVRLAASEPEFIGPVNLGNPNELSIRALAERIVALTGSGSSIVYKPAPRDREGVEAHYRILREATFELTYKPLIVKNNSEIRRQPEVKSRFAGGGVARDHDEICAHYRCHGAGRRLPGRAPARERLRGSRHQAPGLVVQH